MKKLKIDFLVLGAQKCASSWMYNCLKEHSELSLPKKKKEVEYMGGDLYETNGGLKWYQSLFNNTQGKIVGDVSVDYLVDPRSPAEIHRHFPDTKLVIILRNPIQRLQSAYYWYLRKALVNKDEKVQDRILEIIQQENGHYNEKWLDLVNRGIYEEQVSRYLEYFPANQFKIVFYEEIERNSLKTIQNIYHFLGANQKFIPSSINVIPKKNLYNSKLIQIERLFSSVKLFSYGIDKLSQLLTKKSKADLFDNNAFKQLELYYKPYNLKLYDEIVSNGINVIGDVNCIKRW